MNVDEEMKVAQSQMQLEALKAAEEALCDYACQTPDQPCLRDPIRDGRGNCLGARGGGDCGKPASDALTIVRTAISKASTSGEG